MFDDIELNAIQEENARGYSHNPWLVIKTCSFEHVFV